jgi:hypothetical protein
MPLPVRRSSIECTRIALAAPESSAPTTRGKLRVRLSSTPKILTFPYLRTQLRDVYSNEVGHGFQIQRRDAEPSQREREHFDPCFCMLNFQSTCNGKDAP